MTFTLKDIEKLSQLAHLNCKDPEGMINDLHNIMAMIDQINEVDTSNITPMAHPLDSKQRLREDTVTSTNERESIQAVAPPGCCESGLYLVPKVVE